MTQRNLHRVMLIVQLPNLTVSQSNAQPGCALAEVTRLSRGLPSRASFQPSMKASLPHNKMLRTQRQVLAVAAAERPRLDRKI